MIVKNLDLEIFIGFAKATIPYNDILNIINGKNYKVKSTIHETLETFLIGQTFFNLNCFITIIMLLILK